MAINPEASKFIQELLALGKAKQPGPGLGTAMQNVDPDIASLQQMLSETSGGRGNFAGLNPSGPPVNFLDELGVGANMDPTVNSGELNANNLIAMIMGGKYPNQTGAVGDSIAQQGAKRLGELNPNPYSNIGDLLGSGGADEILPSQLQELAGKGDHSPGNLLDSLIGEMAKRLGEGGPKDAKFMDMMGDTNNGSDPHEQALEALSALAGGRQLGKGPNSSGEVTGDFHGGLDNLLNSGIDEQSIVKAIMEALANKPDVKINKPAFLADQAWGDPSGNDFSPESAGFLAQMLGAQ